MQWTVVKGGSRRGLPKWQHPLEGVKDTGTSNGNEVGPLPLGEGGNKQVTRTVSLTVSSLAGLCIYARVFAINILYAFREFGKCRDSSV